MTTPPLPTEEEVRARAEELQLIEPGADLPHDVRRRVARDLHEARKKPAPPPAPPQPVLLSRTTQPAIGGVLRVDVVFIPDTPE